MCIMNMDHLLFCEALDRDEVTLLEGQVQDCVGPDGGRRNDTSLFKLETTWCICATIEGLR